MGKKLLELKRFSSKVGTLLLAGCVAAAFTPGMALAHYEYDNTPGTTKAIIGNSGDPLNGGIEKVTADGNGKTYDEHTQIYRGYAHSDNGAHYQGYTVYTAMTVDDNGILTAVDITSGNDTFAGKWGNSQKSSGRNGNNPVNGYLPEGVDFTATQNSDGTWTPVLNGAEKYGLGSTTITLMSVNENGSADSAGEGDKIVSDAYTGDKTKIDTVKTTTTTADGKEVTTKDADYYNLVKCSYVIGNDKTLFDTYFSVGARAEAADKYIDNCVHETTWEEYPATGFTTNRDGWTAIMATLTLRQLESWGATMADPSISTDVDGEIATIDTVSGATKTATPFAAALNKAHESGFIKGVSENVAMTIDGARIGEANMPGLSVNNAVEGSSYQDVVSVTKDENGLYSVEGTFKPYGGGRLSVDAITLYDLSEAKLGTQGVMALSKELATADNQFEDYKIWQQIPTDANGDGTPKFYNNDDESHILPYGARSSEYTNTFTVSGRGGSTTYTFAGEEGDSNFISVEFRKTDDAYIDYKIQTKDPKATHLAMTYTLGHGRVSSIYDLENLTKVPEVSALLAAASASDEASVTAARAAFDALPYDVRPFTTDIGTLQQAEAELAAAQLAAVDPTDEAAVEAARAAYDKLDAAAKAKVDAAALQKLTDAETAIATAKAEAQKAADKEANLANGTVTVAGLTYTGKAQTAKVTVKSKSGKTLKAGTDYTVSGNKQTKAGTYTVKVTGKGAYKGTKSAKLTVKAASNSAKAAKKSVKKTYKASKVKKKAQKVSLPKVTTKFGTAKWKVVSKDKKKVLSLSGSKIKVKKGAKKKTYTIKVKATVAKTANYAAASTKTVTVKVEVQ